MNNTYNISISTSAAKKIKSLFLDGSEKGKKLRISVEGGGCSGFQYKYDFINDTSGKDMIIKHLDAEIIIDDISAQFMQNAIIDYVETLGFSSFEIVNPNSKSRCGCGNSFST